MGSYHVAQTGLTLMSILLPQPLQYQNCKHKPPYLACALFQQAGTRGHFRKRLFKSFNILSVKALPSAILPHEVTHPFPGGFCTARALLSQLQTHWLLDNCSHFVMAYNLKVTFLIFKIKIQLHHVPSSLFPIPPMFPSLFSHSNLWLLFFYDGNFWKENIQLWRTSKRFWRIHFKTVQCWPFLLLGMKSKNVLWSLA